MSVKATEELFDQLMKNHCCDETYDESDEEDQRNSKFVIEVGTLDNEMEILEDIVTVTSCPNANENSDSDENETDSASEDESSCELVSGNIGPPIQVPNHLNHGSLCESADQKTSINKDSFVNGQSSDCQDEAVHYSSSNLNQVCSGNVDPIKKTDNVLEADQNIKSSDDLNKTCDLSNDSDGPNSSSVNADEDIKLSEHAKQFMGLSLSDCVNPSTDSSNDSHTYNSVLNKKTKKNEYNFRPPPLKKIRTEIVVVEDLSDESGDDTALVAEPKSYIVTDEESQPDSVVRIPNTKPLEVLETVNVVNPYGIDLNPSTSGHYESVETITIDANQRTQDEDLPIEISSDEEEVRVIISNDQSKETISQKESQVSCDEPPQLSLIFEKTGEKQVNINQPAVPNILPLEDIRKNYEYLKSLRIFSNLTSEIENELSGNSESNKAEESSDSKENNIDCKGCNKKFSVHRFYYLHYARATAKIVYSCDDCKKKICFPNPCLLKSHMKSHSTPLNSIKISESNLNVELPSLSEYNEKCLLSCKLSGMGLWSNEDSDDDMDYGCIVCKKRFRYLVEHFMFDPTNYANNFKCPTCNLLFTSKCSFEIHKRIHVGGKPYGCPECGTTFITYNRLLAHLSLECFHLKRRIFIKCLCGIVLLDQKSLKEHIQSKHRFIFYKCDLCAQIFRFLSELQHHMRLKHKSVLKLEDKNIFDKCGLCTVNRMVPRAEYDDHLIYHIEDETTVFFSYYCRKCRLLAPNPLTFQEHMNNSADCRAHELALLKKTFPQVPIPTLKRICKDYSKPEVQKTLNSVYGSHKDIYLQIESSNQGDPNTNESSDKLEDESGTIMTCLLCRKKFTTYAQISDHISGYHKCQDEINKYIRVALQISDGDDDDSDEDPSIEDESEAEANANEVEKKDPVEVGNDGKENSSTESVNEANSSHSSTSVIKPVSSSSFENIDEENKCINGLSQKINSCAKDKDGKVISSCENVNKLVNSSADGMKDEASNNVDQTDVNNLVSTVDRDSSSFEGLEEEVNRSTAPTYEGNAKCNEGNVEGSNKNSHNHIDDVVQANSSGYAQDNQVSSCSDGINILNCSKTNDNINSGDRNEIYNELQSSKDNHVQEEISDKIVNTNSNIEDIIEITSDEDEENINNASNQLYSKTKMLSSNSESKRNLDVTEEKLACPHCAFWTCSKKYFRRHVINHRDENSFQCLECGNCFVCKNALEIHLISVHSIDDVLDYMKTHNVHNSPIEPDEEVNLVPHQCPVCFEIFSNNTTFLIHFRSHGMAFLRKSFANRLGS